MILINRNKRLTLSIPVLKRNGYTTQTTFSVSGSPGLDITFSPISTSGGSNISLQVVVDVTQNAALGDNYIEITGNPAPNPVKRLVFSVSDAPPSWEFGQPYEG